MPLFELFIKKTAFPLIAKRDGMPRLYREISELEESQFWPKSRLMESQLVKIKKLLCHAYENTTFYRTRFDKSSFNPYNLSDFEALQKIPVLTKKDIKENLPHLIARNYCDTELRDSTTGGTTGVKIRFFRNKGCLEQKQAALYRFEKWTGWDFGERMGLVWPASVDYVGHHTWKARLKNEFSRRALVLPAAVMHSQMISNYLLLIHSKRPTMIRGFPSPLCELAGHAAREGQPIDLKGVISTGEPIFPHQRELIENAFHCKVFDAYWTREGGPIAQQCEVHSALHINAECIYLEVAPLNCSAPNFGNILVTDLLNYGMPLIRYQIDDIGELSDERCPCGRSLPLLKNIGGRTTDVFLSPEGHQIMGGALVLYLVDEAPGSLGQIQIVQDRLDHLLIRMTRVPKPSPELMAYQVNKVRQLFGPAMEVSFQLVDEIPREASGKYRFTISQFRSPRHHAE